MSANNRIHYTDDDGDELIVDEAELVEIGLDIRPIPEPRKRERRVFFKKTPDRVAALLVEAGFDPAHIPTQLRSAALDVAGCWSMGLCDDADIACAMQRSIHVVRKAARALNVAGIPTSTSLSTPKPQPPTER